MTPSLWQHYFCTTTNTVTALNWSQAQGQISSHLMPMHWRDLLLQLLKLRAWWVAEMHTRPSNLESSKSWSHGYVQFGSGDAKLNQAQPKSMSKSSCWERNDKCLDEKTQKIQANKTNKTNKTWTSSFTLLLYSTANHFKLSESIKTKPSYHLNRRNKLVFAVKPSCSWICPWDR